MPYYNLKIDDETYTFIKQNKQLEGESLLDFITGAIQAKVAEKKAIRKFIDDRRKEQMRLARLKSFTK